MNFTTKMLVAFGVTTILSATQLPAWAVDTSTEKVSRKEQVKMSMLKKMGGFVTKPNSARGKVVFVDAQSILNTSNVTFAADEIQKSTRFTTECVKDVGSDANELKAKYKADVVVLAVSDTTMPVLLVSPEERWAKVNVNRLAEGLKSEAAKAKFVESRYRKELLRAFAFAAGGTSSQFPDNIMQTASVAELDVCSEQLPYDSIAKAKAFMKKVGMEPAVMATYRQACRQGWASQPTNEIQKAIWDEIHAMPTEPIKIKPETKKVEK